MAVEMPDFIWETCLRRSPATPTILIGLTDILISVWLRHCNIWKARALRAREWEVETLQAIRYELEKKVAKVDNKSIEESLLPWSDDEGDIMSELQSRKRMQDAEKRIYEEQ